MGLKAKRQPYSYRQVSGSVSSLGPLFHSILQQPAGTDNLYVVFFAADVNLAPACSYLSAAHLTGGLHLSRRKEHSEIWGPFLTLLDGWGSKSLGEVWLWFSHCETAQFETLESSFHCHPSVFLSVFPSHPFDKSMEAARIYPSPAIARSPGNNWTKIWSSLKLLNPQALGFRSV